MIGSFLANQSWTGDLQSDKPGGVGFNGLLEAGHDCLRTIAVVRSSGLEEGIRGLPGIEVSRDLEIKNQGGAPASGVGDFKVGLAGVEDEGGRGGPDRGEGGIGA